MKRNIYLASSWRNPFYELLLARLREAGHEVYDFKNPAPGQEGFSWQACGSEAAGTGPGAGAKTIPAYLEALRSFRAIEGFSLDKAALDKCDTLVLALPCNRSAHLEAGYAAGLGKDVHVLLNDVGFEPELMYLLCGRIHETPGKLLAALESPPLDAFRWHTENGGAYLKPSSHAVRLLREVVELCVASGAQPLGVLAEVTAELAKAEARDEFLRPGEDVETGGSIAGELADCQILLEVIARHAGVDLLSRKRSKVHVLWKRQWQADEGGALYRPGTVGT